MNLYAEARSGALVVSVKEERLDAAIAIRFKDRMREVTMQPAQRVVLDLSEVEFLDSSGLGAVVAVMKALAPERQLELAGLRPNVEKVFRLTRMDSVFSLHEDVDAALRKGLRHVG
ncbi:anti-sigma B factor antagonist [Rhodobacter aestuarii]|uniref:Anti-sigma factor antagonist n=1 Tax=Rhodobacter aestuarii TaxID=453582 RepID=A0A1N7KAS4_9RHOB|nr:MULTISPECIES: STAS domain-containing protein [Rhodobacter]PTV95788.1 anti-sigma B factor antagonist [Rhodobacter aestuarii]SIS58524.1 anti-sigma B factor antagonist [Rhodobacter aestuarii]SOC17246.1 anti-sigma B factor antagonist [Rhodobacter sp. JA431]